MSWPAYTTSPQGSGYPPANYVPSVGHLRDEFVVWHKDANGWAVGYHIELLPTLR